MKEKDSEKRLLIQIRRNNKIGLFEINPFSGRLQDLLQYIHIVGIVRTRD